MFENKNQQFSRFHLIDSQSKLNKLKELKSIPKEIKISSKRKKFLL